MSSHHARRLVALGAIAGSALVSTPALAHWCNCLWASGYNLVLRPAQDSVSVPASGTTTLDVFVQNNMGYPLVNFVLNASATGYTITVAGPAPKVSNYLMPGEKLRRTLTLGKSGGGSLAVEQIRFYVSFGNGSQSGTYGTSGTPPGNAVAIRKTNGSLAPSTFPGLSNSGSSSQAQYLRNMALADFGNATNAFDSLSTGTGAGLMEQYCAGRGSWDSGSASSMVGTYCPNLTTTTCPARVTRTSLTKYEAQHLWSAAALVERKSVLGASRIAALRARFKCGWDDAAPAARYLAAFALGYLGDEAASRTFLEGIVNGSGTAADKNVAKSALLMMGTTSYSADVNACAVVGGDAYAASACAGAVGIVEKNDAKVQEVLLAKARWLCPGECDTTADPTGFFASHILSIVAWDRRGYQAGGADTGEPSFYGTGPADTVKPKAPTGVSCTANDNGTIRVNWTGVTQGVDNNPETGVSYKVYSDTTAHASCANPGDAGCNYAHVDPASGIFRDFSSLDGTRTYHYRVTAVDAASNESAFSAEVNCKPKMAPVAQLTCTPATGDAPLDSTCSAAASTDGNGAADIATYAFKLDAAAEESGTANSKSYHFDAAGGHTVQVRITDSTGLSSTKTATITVTQAGNQPPVAAGTATPLTGPAPLTVAFDAAGSSDPEGSALTYSWSFGDGSAAETTETASHTYTDAGTYTATLTVTDSAGASSTKIFTIDAKGNRPPDVSSASAAPSAGPAPLVVHFDATGVTDPDGDNVTLTWDFGDGSAVSHEKAVDHTYSAEGTVTAKLSAQDDGAPAIGPATASFTIGVGVANRAPDCASATVSPAQGALPAALHLDASGCTDPDGNKLTFTWRVQTSFTEEATYATAVADHTVPAEAAKNLPTALQINLTVADDGVPSQQIARDFTFTISTGGGGGFEPVVSGCGCSAAGGASGALGLLVLGLGLGLRRRR